MHGAETFDQHLARLLDKPDFAAAWAVEKPFGDLGLNVWSLREAKGMTQQQLAEAARMKQPRIADIERGDSNPTLLTISRIAVALGVTADRLLAEPDEALLARARAISDARYASRPKRGRATKTSRHPGPAEEPAPRRRRATA